MKSAFEIDYIYEKLASKYHYYSNQNQKFIVKHIPV
jgi:hypothetical protein